MPKIIGEPIPDYVAYQINKRQSVHGKTHDRTAEDIAYLNSKTAWVKLASGVALSDERIIKENFETKDHPIPYDTLARQYVLFGGTSSKKEESLNQRGTDPSKNNIYDLYSGMYNVNMDKGPSKYGLAPMPGIISADIQCLNRGSIKKATVKIKCYTPEQFHILDILYMRIGYTMLLEWGSSFYHNDEKNRWENMGYTLTEAADGFFAQTDYYAMLPRIEGYRKAKSGNYDGLISKVVNFNWSFAQDGSYDITLELISVGDVIESLKCNVIPPYEMTQIINQSYTSYVGDTSNNSEQDTQQDNPSTNILSSYLFIQKLYLQEADSSTSRDVTLKYSGGQVEIGAVKITPPSGGLTIGDVISTGEFDQEDQVRAYINQNYPGLKETSNISNGQRNNEFYIVSTFGMAGRKYVGKIFIYSNSQNIEITPQGQHTNVVYFNYNNGEQDQSSDLGFYMRLGHLLNFIQERVIPHNSKTSEPIIKIDTYASLNKMYTMPYQVSFDPRVCIVNGREKVNTKEFYPELDAWKMDGEDYTARIMNIYVNHNHINQLVLSHLDEKGNFNLFSFLQTLCTDINKALGGINTLEPIIDEDEQVITIIDQSYSPAKQAGDKYGLELYGYNSEFKSSNFVRNISLKTEITPEFATMATIGSTAGGYVKGTENTMFSKWNKGIIDRYKEEFTSGTQTPEQMKEDVRKTYLEDFWKQRSSAFGLKVSDGNVTLDDNIIEKNITNATEFYKLVYAKMQENNPQYASPSNGFIPISLGVTMDGISGFKIYNSLNVSTKFLPANYGENLHFIVKSVNHKLSNNDWETTLETVVIAKNDTNG
jgi:hypothetical protein